MATTRTERGLDHLDEDECIRLLRLGYVGRLGWVDGERAVIVPVNYRIDEEGAILLLTAPGSKLDAARAGAVLSLQVGSEDELYHRGWSVLASGRAEVVEPPRSLAFATDNLLRPWARDPDRTHLLRIRPDRVEGRRIA